MLELPPALTLPLAILAGLLVPNQIGLVGLVNLLPAPYVLGVAIGGDAALGARADRIYRQMGIIMGLIAAAALSQVPTEVYMFVCLLLCLYHLAMSRGVADVACNALCIAGAMLVAHHKLNIGVVLCGLNTGYMVGSLPHRDHRYYTSQTVDGGNLLGTALMSALAWVSPPQWLLGNDHMQGDDESIEKIEAMSSGITLAMGIILGAARSGPLQFANLGEYTPLPLLALVIGAGLLAEVLPIARIPRSIGTILALALAVYQNAPATLAYLGLGLALGALDRDGYHTNGVVPFIPAAALFIR